MANIYINRFSQNAFVDYYATLPIPFPSARYYGSFRSNERYIQFIMIHRAIRYIVSFVYQFGRYLLCDNTTDWIASV